MKLKVTYLIKNEPTRRDLPERILCETLPLSQGFSTATARCKKMHDYRAPNPVQRFELGFAVGLLQLAKLCSLPSSIKIPESIKVNAYYVRSVSIMGG